MKRFSLSKRERIVRTAEFKSALRKSSFFSGKSIKFGVSPNGLGYSRIGVSLRRENFRLAVQRNKVRRFIKEAYRLNKGRFAKGYDIIIIPKSGILDLGLKDITTEFLVIADKALIIGKGDV